MGRDLVNRVVIASAALLLPLSVAAALLAGRAALLGILVGGGVTLGNLLWLSHASDPFRGRPLWFLSVGLRYLTLFAALALSLWSGRVHPLALIVGLSVLPPVLIVQGLRSARLSA
jgi:hypothetical protein